MVGECLNGHASGGSLVPILKELEVRQPSRQIQPLVKWVLQLRPRFEPFEQCPKRLLQCGCYIIPQTHCARYQQIALNGECSCLANLFE